MLLTPKSTEITLPEVHLLLPRYNLLLKQLLMRDVEKKAKSGGELTEIVNLDHHRYEDIPSRVQARKNDSQETWLEKTEVELLMKWKLYSTLVASSAQINCIEPILLIESIHQKTREISPPTPRPDRLQLRRRRQIHHDARIRNLRSQQSRTKRRCYNSTIQIERRRPRNGQPDPLRLRSHGCALLLRRAVQVGVLGRESGMG